MHGSTKLLLQRCSMQMKIVRDCKNSKKILVVVPDLVAVANQKCNSERGESCRNRNRNDLNETLPKYRTNFFFFMSDNCGY